MTFTSKSIGVARKGRGARGPWPPLSILDKNKDLGRAGAKGARGPEKTSKFGAPSLKKLLITPQTGKIFQGLIYDLFRV